MTFKNKIVSCQLSVVSATFALAAFCFAQGPAGLKSEQQISEFSLSGYGEKGKKNWDLAGESANIFPDTVSLKNIEGNLYGKEEDVKLTAEKGDFNKKDGLVHLEDNVVITTSSGAKLTTDSLDWDRKDETVTTDDNVNIERQNMVTVAKGAKGDPGLKKIALEKEVRVDINPSQESRDREQLMALSGKEKITVTCDGPLEIDYDKNIATFNNNVKVERQDSVIYSDKMELFFEGGNSIERIVSSGNVKIVRGDNTSYSDEAVYNASDRKITLTGRPKLIIYSSQEFNDALIGN